MFSNNVNFSNIFFYLLILQKETKQLFDPILLNRGKQVRNVYIVYYGNIGK